MTDQINGEVSSKARTGKSIQVNGDWYGCFDPVDLNHVNRGDTVTLNWKPSKCGRFKNIVGKPKVGGGAAAPAAPASGGQANNGGGYRPQGRTFPVAPLAPERTINRQNALTNAVAYFTGVYEGDGKISAEDVVRTARIFEAYTCGDVDAEEAEAAMNELGG